ncbi:MAG: DPP IV N-terminal domain-containing protein [Deltaproteobacteria bacterium]|nr:DPP IV N-terminal domain-containing protein [Deltaproteobacteria bacterium]
MTKKLFIWFISLIAALSVVSSAKAQDDLEFENPSVLIPVTLGGTFNRYRVAVNDLLPAKAGGRLDDTTAKALIRRLTLNLDMTGYFDLLDPRASLEFDPRAGLSQGPPIDYSPWAQIGANFVVKGALETSGSKVVLDLYLFDVLNGRQLLAKRYTGPAKEAKKLVAFFTNDLLLSVTGEAGVFGSKIIYVAGDKSNQTIMITELGLDEAETLAGAKGGPATEPTIGPGNRTAWTHRNKNKWELVSDGRVVHSGATVFTPAYSPTGALVAGLSGRVTTNIALFEGKSTRQLTSGGSIEISPTFSPDGRMAYVSDQGGVGIYVTSAGGGPGRRISPPGTSTDPSWSPKGDKIVFVYRNQDICIMNSDGSNVIQLTNQGVNHHPSFSPDGRMIVFSSTRGGGGHKLYVMSANGDRQQPLMADYKGGSQTLPTWSPELPQP